jgi:DNA-binding NarL/FixJ family response regulator
MDERVYRLVMSQPVPMRLAIAIERAPDLTVNRTPARLAKARVYSPSLDPDDMTPILRTTLALICHGRTNEEIARETFYALDTVRDRTKALLAIFAARNRTHLAALAVAQGYVDMSQAV